MEKTIAENNDLLQLEGEKVNFDAEVVVLLDKLRTDPKDRGSLEKLDLLVKTAKVNGRGFTLETTTTVTEKSEDGSIAITAENLDLYGKREEGKIVFVIPSKEEPVAAAERVYKTIVTGSYRDKPYINFNVASQGSVGVFSPSEVLSLTLR